MSYTEKPLGTGRNAQASNSAAPTEQIGEIAQQAQLLEYRATQLRIVADAIQQRLNAVLTPAEMSTTAVPSLPGTDTQMGSFLRDTNIDLDNTIESLRSTLTRIEL